MELRPYKFVVIAIVQQVEEGVVTGEQEASPVTLFGAAELEEWAKLFEDRLAVVGGAEPEPEPKKG